MLKSNQEALLEYFHVFRENQYSKWMSALSTTVTEEKNFFSGAVYILQSETWKTVAGTPPPTLPDIDSLSMNSAPIPIHVSSSPPPLASSPIIHTTISSAPPSEPSLPVLRSGYLMKKGGNRHNWKKRWFVFDSSKFQYFENEAAYQVRNTL